MPNSYVVQPGDSWAKIAGSVYGDQRMLGVLQRANPGVSHLRPGMVLSLPEREANPYVSQRDLQGLGGVPSAPAGQVGTTQVPNPFLTPPPKFWETPEFQQTLEQNRAQQAEAARIEVSQESIQRGDRLYADPYGNITNRSHNGRPLYWDPQKSEPTLEPTPIPLVAGMVSNVPMPWKGQGTAGVAEAVTQAQRAYNEYIEGRIDYARAGNAPAPAAEVPPEQPLVPARQVPAPRFGSGAQPQIVSEGEERPKVYNVEGLGGSLQTVPASQMPNAGHLILLGANIPKGLIGGLLDPERGAFAKTVGGLLATGIEAGNMLFGSVMHTIQAMVWKAQQASKREEPWTWLVPPYNILKLERTILEAVFGPTPNVPKPSFNIKRHAVDVESGAPLTDAEVQFRIQYGKEDTMVWKTDWEDARDRVLRAWEFTTRAWDELISGKNPDYLLVAFATSQLGQYASTPEVAAVQAEQYRLMQTLQDERARNKDLAGVAREEASQALARGDMAGAVEALTQAYSLEGDAAVLFDPLFAYTWVSYPANEQAFYKALAEAEIQKGEPLNYWEIQNIKDRFVHPSLEFMGEVVLDLWNVVPVETISRILSPLARKASAVGRKVFSPVSRHFAESSMFWARFYRWFKAPAVASAARRIIYNGVQDVASSIGRSMAHVISPDASVEDLASIFQKLGQAFAPGVDEARRAELLTEIPITISPRTEKILREAAAIYEEGAKASYVKLVNPLEWGNVVRQAYDNLLAHLVEQQKKLRLSLKGPRKYGVYETLAELEADARDAAIRVANNPKGPVVQEIAEIFRRAYVSKRTIAGGFPEDSLLYKIARATGVLTRESTMGLTPRQWSSALVSMMRLSDRIQSAWAYAVLSMRPAWVFYNYVDSAFRYLVYGEDLFTDIEWILRTLNPRAIKKIAQEMSEHIYIPGEAGTTFAELATEAGESFIQRLVFTDWSPKWGPFSFIAYQWGKKGRPRGGGFFRWLKETIGRGWTSVGDGLREFNQAIEFSLRLRMIYTNYSKAFNLIDARNFLKAVEELRSMPGLSDATKTRLEAIHLVAGNDAEKMMELARRLRGAGAPGRRIWSALLSEELVDILRGFDPLDRDMVLRPVLKTIDELMAAAGDEVVSPSEIRRIFQEVRTGLSEEALARDSDPMTHAVREAVEDVTAKAEAAADETIDAASAPTYADPRPRQLTLEGGEVVVGKKVPEPAPAPVRPAIEDVPGERITLELGDMTDDEARRALIDPKVQVAAQTYVNRAAELRKTADLWGQQAKGLRARAAELRATDAAQAQKLDVQAALLDTKRSILIDYHEDMSLLRPRVINWLANYFPGPTRMTGYPRMDAWQVVATYRERMLTVGEKRLANLLERLAASDDVAPAVFTADDFLREVGLRVEWDGNIPSKIHLDLPVEGLRTATGKYYPATRLRQPQSVFDGLMTELFGPNANREHFQWYMMQAPYSRRLLEQIDRGQEFVTPSVMDEVMKAAEPAPVVQQGRLVVPPVHSPEPGHRVFVSSKGQFGVVLEELKPAKNGAPRVRVRLEDGTTYVAQGRVIKPAPVGPLDNAIVQAVGQEVRATVAEQVEQEVQLTPQIILARLSDDSKKVIEEYAAARGMSPEDVVGIMAAGQAPVAGGLNPMLEFDSMGWVDLPEDSFGVKSREGGKFGVVVYDSSVDAAVPAADELFDSEDEARLWIENYARRQAGRPEIPDVETYRQQVQAWEALPPDVRASVDSARFGYEKAVENERLVRAANTPMPQLAEADPVLHGVLRDEAKTLAENVEAEIGRPARRVFTELPIEEQGPGMTGVWSVEPATHAQWYRKVLEVYGWTEAKPVANRGPREIARTVRTVINHFLSGTVPPERFVRQRKVYDIIVEEIYRRTTGSNGFLGRATRLPEAVEREVMEALAKGGKVGPAVTETVARQINEAESAAWRAFIHAPWDGVTLEGKSLRDMFGEVTESQEQFLNALDERITQMLEQNYDETAPEALDAMIALRHEVEQFDTTARLVRQSQGLPDSVGITPRAMPLVSRPAWKMPESWKTWLGSRWQAEGRLMQLNRFLDKFEADLVRMAEEGNYALRFIPEEEFQQAMAWAKKWSHEKGVAQDIALYGSDGAPIEALGNRPFAGAVPMTNYVMLDYDAFTNFDSMMKNFFPFWKFPSRSLPLWVKTMAAHPEIMAFYQKYIKFSERSLIQAGAVDSRGNPLPHLYGNVRIPGTNLWFDPLAPLSFKFAFRIVDLISDQFQPDQEEPGRDVLTHLVRMGQHFGFNVGPLLTVMLHAGGLVDSNQVIPFSIVPQLDLIPKWWKTALVHWMRRIHMPGLVTFPVERFWSPDVSYQDYLIQNYILEQSYQRLLSARSEAERDQIIRDVKAALRNQEDSTLWRESRIALEKTEYFRRVVGYFTGIFAKDWTDAEAELRRLRTEYNHLVWAINNELGAEILMPDLDEEERYKFYVQRRFQDSDGQIYSLYNIFRWTVSPEGKQLYGADRQKLILQRLDEEERTEAYYQARESIFLERQERMNALPIGADNAEEIRRINDDYFAKLRALDENPIYDGARRVWSVGYKPESMIWDTFRDKWWYTIQETKPRWDREGETYPQFQQRVLEWELSLPQLAETAAKHFLQEVAERVRFEGPAYDAMLLRWKIPGNRVLDAEALLDLLVKETTASGYEEWRRQRADTIYDALTDAYTQLYVDPIFRARDLGGYEGELALTEFLESHPRPPTPAELAKWVQERYGDRWSAEELIARASVGDGPPTFEERFGPSDELGKDIDQAWDIISWAGPDKDKLRDTYRKLGGDLDYFDIWRTGDIHVDPLDSKEVARFKVFHDKLVRAAAALNLRPPSKEELQQWATAQALNDTFREMATNRFGEDFWDTLSIWYGSSRAERRVIEKDRPDIQAYFEMKELFGVQNPIWAKFYGTDEQKKALAEGRSLTAPSGGGGGGGRTRREARRGGGGGGSARPVVGRGVFLPIGERTSIDPNRLLAGIGRGGVGKAPRWPPGFAAAVGPIMLAEIEDAIANNRPLHPATITYLEGLRNRKPEHAPTVSAVLDFTRRNIPEGTGPMASGAPAFQRPFPAGFTPKGK